MDLLSQATESSASEDSSQENSETPSEQVLAFEVLGVDGTTHQFPLCHSNHPSQGVNEKAFDLGPPEVALAAGTDPIGYSRRHLSSRSDRLGERVKKHVDALLGILKKRALDRSQINISSVNASSRIENRSETTYYRNVSLESPGDIYAFIEENIGKAALQEAVESKPLKVRCCCVLCCPSSL